MKLTICILLAYSVIHFIAGLIVKHKKVNEKRFDYQAQKQREKNKLMYKKEKGLNDALCIRIQRFADFRNDLTEVRL